MASKKPSKTNLRARDLDAAVRDYISRQGNATFNYRQVSYALGADTAKFQRAIALLLAEMAFDGDIVETAPGKYKNINRTTEATGVFVRRSNGKNSVITDEDAEAIFVAERNSMHALNGDRVRVSVAARRRGAEPEAEVIEILEKKDQVFIGTLKVDKYFAYLLTDSKFLATDIFIPRNRLKGGKTGDKAIVRITEWNDDDKNPRGEVVDILGVSGENQAEMHAILAEFGLPYRYPASVEKAAEKIPDDITDEEISRRDDMRDRITFTIDPRDAKDFDDALSLKKLPNGNYEVGVHIADVTHYVRPESALDRFVEYMGKLATAVGKEKLACIDCVTGALTDRIEFFAEMGCRASDHGLDYIPYREATKEEVNAIYQKAMKGEAVTTEEAEKYQTYILIHLGKQYHRLGIAMQIHYNCLRGVNRKMNTLLGPDTGFDMINTATCGGEIAALLSALNDTDECPKTIIYSLNPADDAQIGTILGCFQNSEVPGKIQHGSAWWFNDHKIGMEEQMSRLASLGLLGNFVGMLTDSRSFLSYTRHDYFRRILCNIIGQWVEDGEYPNDEKALEKIVKGICFDNAKRYFNL